MTGPLFHKGKSVLVIREVIGRKSICADPRLSRGHRVFVNEVNGKNALASSRNLGMSHKACWVMLHRVREAMAEEFRGRKIGGADKAAEVDGAYFGAMSNRRT